MKLVAPVVSSWIPASPYAETTESVRAGPPDGKRAGVVARERARHGVLAVLLEEDGPELGPQPPADVGGARASAQREVLERRRGGRRDDRDARDRHLDPRRARGPRVAADALDDHVRRRHRDDRCVDAHRAEVGNGRPGDREVVGADPHRRRGAVDVDAELHLVRRAGGAVAPVHLALDERENREPAAGGRRARPVPRSRGRRAPSAPRREARAPVAMATVASSSAGAVAAPFCAASIETSASSRSARSCSRSSTVAVGSVSSMGPPREFGKAGEAAESLLEVGGSAQARPSFSRSRRTGRRRSL